jgi:hypothetical protein
MKNRGEMIKIMPGYLAIKDPALIDQLYDLYLTRQSVDGSVDENWMRGAIEFTQKTLGAGVKDIPPNQVFDFSLSKGRYARVSVRMLPGWRHQIHSGEQPRCWRNMTPESGNIEAADFCDRPTETTLKKPDDFLQKSFVVKIQGS